MSGIYIQGAEMPKSCWVCELGGAEQLDKHPCPFYSMEYWEQENYQEKIADGCPLVPVPPHGDLIERSAAYLTDFEIATCFGNFREGMKMLLEKLENAPTIIEADHIGDVNEMVTDKEGEG